MPITQHTSRHRQIPNEVGYTGSKTTQGEKLQACFQHPAPRSLLPSDLARRLQGVVVNFLTHVCFPRKVNRERYLTGWLPESFREHKDTHEPAPDGWQSLLTSLYLSFLLAPLLSPRATLAPQNLEKWQETNRFSQNPPLTSKGSTPCP